MTIAHLTRLGISTLSVGALCSACIIIGDTNDPNNATGGTGDVDVARCGDGKVQAGEDCDLGAQNSDTGDCTTACKSPTCGDGLVQKGVEACDDANRQNGDGCNNNCLVSGTPQWTQDYNGATNGEDVWNAVAIDASGSVYVAGREATADQGSNAVVSKYDAKGKVIWKQSYNGAASGDDQAIGITVDPKGQIIAVGEEANPDKTTDIWVRKYSPTGEPVWTQKFNGGAAGFNNTGYEVATNAAGDIFLAAGVQTVANQGRNVYVAKLSSTTGAVVWADSLDGPGSSDDEAFGITVDATGNIVAAGYISTAKGLDVWVRKYKDNGADYSIIWTQTYNDSSNEADYAFSVATDPKGNIVVSGAETGVNSQLNAWVRKYDADGNTLWTQDYRGAFELNTAGAGVAIDSSGNVVVTGYTTLIDTSVPPTTPPTTTTDLWVRKYSPTGEALWTQLYNDAANGDDAANDIVLDADGNIYVAGSEKVASQNLNGFLRKMEP